MTKLAVLTSIAFACAFSPFSARAESVPALQIYFERKLTQVQTSLNHYNSMAAETEANLAFQDLQIWIAPEASIGVSDVLKLTIAPEIDFILTPPVK